MPCATRNPGDAGPFPLRRDGTEPRGRPSQPEGRPHVGHERSARSSPAEPAQSLGGGVIVDAEMLSDRADGAARGVHLRRRRGDPLIDGRRGRVAERDLDRHPGESANVYLPRPVRVARVRASPPRPVRVPRVQCESPAPGSAAGSPDTASPSCSRLDMPRRARARRRLRATGTARRARDRARRSTRCASRRGS